MEIERRREYFFTIYLFEKSQKRSKKSKYEEFINNSLTEDEVKPTVCCSRGTFKNCFRYELRSHLKFQDKVFIVFASRDYFFQLMLKLADYFVYIMFESKD